MNIVVGVKQFFDVFHLPNGVRRQRARKDVVAQVELLRGSQVEDFRRHRMEEATPDDVEEFEIGKSTKFTWQWT